MRWRVCGEVGYDETMQPVAISSPSGAEALDDFPEDADAADAAPTMVSASAPSASSVLVTTIAPNPYSVPATSGTASDVTTTTPLPPHLFLSTPIGPLKGPP